MTKDTLRFETAKDSDSGALAALRVEAMRPSLEAAGRFDPARARNRFLSSFHAEDTTLVLFNGTLAGFFAVRRHAEQLYLDHFYVAAAWQGMGIGRRVIEDLKAKARSANLPIRLTALNGSPANQFYQTCGFAFVSADALDTLYEWRPGT